MATDLPIEDLVTINSKIADSTAQPVVTRLQSKKKTAQFQAESKEAKAPTSQLALPILPNM